MIVFEDVVVAIVVAVVVETMMIKRTIQVEINDVVVVAAVVDSVIVVDAGVVGDYAGNDDDGGDDDGVVVLKPDMFVAKTDGDDVGSDDWVEVVDFDDHLWYEYYNNTFQKYDLNLTTDLNAANDDVNAAVDPKLVVNAFV